MIIYDLTALQPHGKVLKHGGGMYALYVLERMLHRNIDFVCFYDSSRYIETSILNKLQQSKIILYDIKQIELKVIGDKYVNPLIFSILPKKEYLIFPTIGTIHDCRSIDLINDIYEFLYPISLKNIIKKIVRFLYPKYFYEREIQALNILINNRNFRFNTITNYTKNLLCTYTTLKRYEDIPVFQTPFFIEHFNECVEKKKEILLVSGDRPLKNNLRAIKALDMLFTEGKLNGFRVIVTGATTECIYKYKIVNKSNFIFKGYVCDETLKSLYKTSYMFIYPSLNEGFGIPPLEAMNYYTPVIASNYTAIPEVCQDNVLYIDPLNIDDIKTKILELVENEKLYKNLQQKGKRHALNMYEKSLLDIDRYINYVIQVNNEK